VRAGEVLAVEPKAFRVLLILLRNPQRLIAKEELLNAVWGDAAVTENSLTRSIAVLRKALGDDSQKPQYIETVATVGYRFLYRAEVSDDTSGNVALVGGRGNDAAASRATPTDEMKSAPVPLQSKSGGTVTNGAIRRGAGLLRKWILAAGIATLIIAGVLTWYLTRPLPKLHVTGYKQLTYDGGAKNVIGTDGSRLYLSVGSPLSIAQVGTTGEKIVPMQFLVNGTNGILLDVSADGSSVLIGTNPVESTLKEIWSDSVMGGSPRRLGNGFKAVFSPEGKTIAFTTNDAIWVANSDGTGHRKLIDVKGFPQQLAWSPDGRLIRFASNNLLWEVSSQGTGLHQLLPGWHVSESQCCGHWTSDGNYFVFVVTTVGSQTIWATDERHLILRRSDVPFQLTTGPIRWGFPIPGKDRKHLFADGASPRGELLRYDARTKQWQPYAGGMSAEYVSFSPDGQFMTYVSYPEGAMWKANRNGSNSMRLSDPPIYACNPRWSPDGSQILFFDIGRSNFGSDIYDIGPSTSSTYINSAEGGQSQPLSSDSKDRADPNWSPDGKKIVFNVIIKRDGQPELRVLDVATREESTVPDSLGMYSPRWSPDGRYLVALSLKIPNIATYDIQQQRWRQLPHTSGAAWPAFSKDGKYLYFLRFTKEDQGIYRSLMHGGEPELVASLKGLKLTGSLNGFMGLDPTDAPLVLRDTGTDDIYALSLEEK
jgi:Tol biopolymer transport system component/DNA-binding winged helix-turn-helix (wHTH) protein